jgi:L-lactate dehydrogenase complex protein LldE
VRVALFVPCFVDQLFPDVGVATLLVLERLGLEVDVPGGAVCCGQPMANAGFEHAGMRPLARLVEDLAAYDRIVVPSGSCVAHLCQHAAGVGLNGARVAGRVRELCTFLHEDIGVERVAALGVTFERRVGVHIGCHALRALNVARPSEIRRVPYDYVREILATVRGLTFAELRRPDECCGFGGTYSVVEPEVSVAMGRDRVRDHCVGGAEAIVSTDMSCLMHLGGVARHQGMNIPMLHVAQVLAEGVA